MLKGSAALLVGSIVVIYATGDIFLSQCLAVFITTLLVIVVPKWRQSICQWLVASLISAFLIAGSFYMFYHGPRIVTEADGPASINYECLLGERSTTVIDFTKEMNTNLDSHNAAATFCVLKNMPLAASNLTFIENDSDLSSGVLFIIGEVLLYTSFVATRATVKRYG